MQMITIIPAENRPDKVTAEEWKQIQRSGPMMLDAVTAFENIRNSKGAYRVKPAEVAKVEFVVPALEEMPNDQLKQLYITTMQALRKTLGKKVTRKAMIQTIRAGLDSIEVVEDEEPEGGPQAEAGDDEVTQAVVSPASKAA